MSDKNDDSRPDWCARILGAWPFALLLILVGVVYAQTVTFGLIERWDDYLYFLGRPEVRDWPAATWRERLLTPQTGYPIPIQTFLYYLVQQAPSTLVVPLAHGLNVVFHACNAMLAFALVSRWTRHRRFAVVLAAIWACHPLMVESVAWVTSLKYLLMGTFALGAIYCWDRHLGEISEPSLSWPIATVACALGALASQPAALGLGLVLVVQAFVKTEPGGWRKPWVWAPIVVIGLLCVAYLPLAASGQHQVVGADQVSQFYQRPVGDQLEQIGAAFFLQVRHALVPVDLHPAYPIELAQRHLFAIFGWVLLAVSGIASGVVLYKHPARAWPIAISWAFYLPVSGIEYLPRFTADNYAYLPLLGTIIGVGLLAEPHIARLAKRFRLASAALVCILLIGLVGLSFVQTRRWQNAATLVQPALHEFPDWVAGYDILAHAYERVGAEEEAIEVLERGFEAQYEYGHISELLPELYERRGDPASAARVRLTMMTYPGAKPPDLHAEFLRGLMDDDVSLGEVEGSREQIRSAVRGAIEKAAEQRGSAFSVRVARHFGSRGAFDLAQHAIETAVRAPHDGCQWAVDLRELVEEVDALERPRIPSDCGNE